MIGDHIINQLVKQFNRFVSSVHALRNQRDAVIIARDIRYKIRRLERISQILQGIQNNIDDCVIFGKCSHPFILCRGAWRIGKGRDLLDELPHLLLRLFRGMFHQRQRHLLMGVFL